MLLAECQHALSITVVEVRDINMGYAGIAPVRLEALPLNRHVDFSSFSSSTVYRRLAGEGGGEGTPLGPAD